MDFLPTLPEYFLKKKKHHCMSFIFRNLYAKKITIIGDLNRTSTSY